MLGLPGSALLRAAEAAGLRTVVEGFADRGYTADGHARARAASPARSCTTRRRSPSGRCGWRPTARSSRSTARWVAVESVCVHGDTPGAVELARAVRAALEAAGLTPAAFAG